jgi:hypothetical protein
MDTERLAVQVGRPGEVDVIGRVAMPDRQRHVLAMTAIGDFRRDWRRWSAIERISAVALSGLWALGVTAAVLADARPF